MTATTATRFTLHPVTPDDYASLARLVSALTEYEKLTRLMRATPEMLITVLFGPRPYYGAVLTEVGGRAVGFTLFFHSFSTFLCKSGLYLEDLFVEPEHRGLGIGKALLIHLARLAWERDCDHFEWGVLDRNAPSVAFYGAMGTDVPPEWRVCRATGDVLTKLATMVVPVSPATPA